MRFTPMGPRRNPCGTPKGVTWIASRVSWKNQLKTENHVKKTNVNIHSPVSTWGCNISDHQKTIEIHWAPSAIHVKSLRVSHGSRTGPRPTHTASVRTLKGYHLSGVGGTRPRCRRHIAFSSRSNLNMGHGSWVMTTRKPQKSMGPRLRSMCSP